MLPLPPPTTEPAVTAKDAAAEDERASATALFFTPSLVDAKQPIAEKSGSLLNETAVNTSSSSDDVKSTQSRRHAPNHQADVVEGDALARPPDLPARTSPTTGPRRRRIIYQGDDNGKSATIRRSSSTQFSESRSGSKTSGSTERCQRKKESAGKTATQKSVLMSKMAFFMFLVTVAAVAGGKVVYVIICMYCRDSICH